MRKQAAAVAGLLLMSTPALADSTYTGTRTVGGQSATVTITTDGTTGILSANNIVNFVVDFSNGSSITGDSTNVSTQGSAFFASSSDLGFNFDYPVGPIGTYFALVGQGATIRNSLYCVQIVSGCGANGTGEVINTFDGYGGADFAAQSGFISLFTLQSNVNSAVPEPGTWAMMLLGFGGIGLMTRRHRAYSAKQQVA